ncbi:DUF4145 domain-containing protein [Paenibacillus sp. FSL R10-2199]|uniref:DUF4145 domain-containing protein n=1 Tax=Paenibacillus sp. FSL R10-2199 TaxID=2975348 RepID=UPI0030F9FF8D
MNYIVPEVHLVRFTCPYCNTLSQQNWSNVYLYKSGDVCFLKTDKLQAEVVEEINSSTCESCGRYHIWIKGRMVQPDSSGIPLPSEDMPEEIRLIYFEAREVFAKSPRASAALLRLALQHLCQHLGGDGKNINDDIAKLVKGGLDVRIQKSLDIVRVTGNNAVHPGQLDLIDNTEISARLFSLLNFIVDAMVTQPKQIETFFKELPQGARDAIEKRDS